jgi:hypothetical protein
VVAPPYLIRYVYGGNIFQYFVGFTHLHITNYGQNKEGKADRAVTRGILGQMKSLGLSLTDGTA